MPDDELKYTEHRPAKEQPPIDLEKVRFEYDFETRKIRVHDWYEDEDPLCLALVVRRQVRPGTHVRLGVYIEILTRCLVELANEKLTEMKAIPAKLSLPPLRFHRCHEVMQLLGHTPYTIEDDIVCIKTQDTIQYATLQTLLHRWKVE